MALLKRVKPDDLCVCVCLAVTLSNTNEIDVH